MPGTTAVPLAPRWTFWDTLDADTLERIMLRAGVQSLIALCLGSGRVAKRCRAMLSRDQTALLDARLLKRGAATDDNARLDTYFDIVPTEVFVHIFAQLANQ